MRNIIRFYNENRLTFWIIVLIIIFIIFLLHFFNGLAREDSKRKIEASKTNEEINTTQTSINKEKKTTEPVTYGEEISNTKKTNNNNTIESFFKYCKNNQIEEAYDLLSSNCKEVYYKTKEEFQKKYFNTIFKSDKEYQYELWSSGKFNIYRIKIFDDMLSTGNAKNGKFIEDYYTIVKEDGKNKININNYIGRENIDKTETIGNLQINIKFVDMYKEKFNYSINIKNTGNTNIILDTREKTNSTYLLNDHDTKIIGLLYENIKEDFEIKPNEQKNINISFNVGYRNDLSIEKMVFSDICLNKQNLKYKTKLEIEI